MRSFMLAVVNDPRGTGTAAQIPGVQVARKTGTAEHVPGENPHAWFVEIAQYDAPRGGGGGGRQADARDLARGTYSGVAVRQELSEHFEQRQIGFPDDDAGRKGLLQPLRDPARAGSGRHGRG